MQKLEIKYGIYGGLAVCAYKVIEFLPSFQKIRIESGIETGLFTLVIVAIFIIWGLKKKRETGGSGSFTFLSAFTTGMIIALLIAVIVIPFVYSYGKFINPTEGEKMLDYARVNGLDNNAMYAQEIHDYYAPRNRSMRSAQRILFVGFIISLFSAAMFRRVPTTAEDFVKNAELPYKVRMFFWASMVFTAIPVIIYILWLLKWSNINTLLFDLIAEPIDHPLGLQEGTGFLSLVAFILNMISYNKITYYGHPLNIWNMRMVLVSIASVLVSVWLIVDPPR